MVSIKRFKRIIFFKDSKNDLFRNNFLNSKVINKNKKNLFFHIIKLLFKMGFSIKFYLLFTKIFSYVLNFILIKKISNNNNNYLYYLFLKKNFNLNKWFLNFNSFFIWFLLNYELIFFFKKSSSNSILSKKNKNNFSFFFILKKKRKKFLFKWINNKINFILKKKINFKILNLFLELILNFKKSNFFKFKNLIYKTILLK